MEDVDRRVAGLFALGAIPLLVYAALKVAKQLGPVNEHILFVHYGAMAIAAFIVIFMGALGIIRRRDWRFATWLAGVTAVAFLAGVERVRRGGVESVTGSRDEAVAETD